jgi:hypothetical protein
MNQKMLEVRPTVSVIIIHLGLAILLFYGFNWIGSHSSAYGYFQLSLVVQSDQAPAFNFILRALTPTVFIILIAAGCYLLNIEKPVFGIWYVAAHYFGFRVLYNVVLGRALLLNWVSLSFQTIVGIATAYLAYLHLILPRRPLFPDLNTMGNHLWILIALFLYAAFNSVRTSNEASARRKNRYIRSRFTSLRDLYGNLIEDQFPMHYMELVAYAILVYETFNRPRIVRAIERAVFPWHSKTIGPMQVRTGARISDRDSVHLGVKELGQCFKATEHELSGKKAKRYDVIRLALAKYNRDSHYIDEVFQVLHVLWAQVAPEYRVEFEHMYSSNP